MLWNKTHKHGKCLKCNKGYVWESDRSYNTCACGSLLSSKFKISNTYNWALLHWDNDQRIEIPLSDHPKYYANHPQNRLTDWAFVSACAVRMLCRSSKDSGEFTKQLVTIGFKKEIL